MARKKIIKKENAKRKVKIKKTVKAAKEYPVKKIVKKKKSRVKSVKKEEYLAEWTALEFIRTKEESFWYYASIGAATLMVLLSLYQKNLIVTLTFSLLILVVAFQISCKPKNIKYKIGLDGIIVDDLIYKYNSIKSFEVIRGDDFNLLKFRLKNAILPVKEVQLAKQDPYYIRAALEYFLPEEEQKETLVGFENKNDLDDEYLSEEDFYEHLKK